MFASDFLCDFLKEKIHQYQAYQIESNPPTRIFIIIDFANIVAHLIQQELRVHQGLINAVLDGELCKSSIKTHL